MKKKNNNKYNSFAIINVFLRILIIIIISELFLVLLFITYIIIKIINN